MSKKKVNIFGTTGSIGQSTFQVLRGNKGLMILLLSLQMIMLINLIKDCLEFKPQYANIGNKRHYLKLKNALSDTNIIVSFGRHSLLDLARINVDWSMSAIIGFAGVEISFFVQNTQKF